MAAVPASSSLGSPSNLYSDAVTCFLLVELAVLEHPRVDGALGGRELGALEGSEVTGLDHLAGRARHHPERLGEVLRSVLVDGVEQRREGRRVRLVVELGRHAEVGLADGGGLGGRASSPHAPSPSAAQPPSGRTDASGGGSGQPSACSVWFSWYVSSQLP